MTNNVFSKNYEQGREVAKKLSNDLNRLAITDFMQGFIDEMSQDHKYIQGQFSRLVAKWIRQNRLQYLTRNYNADNESYVELFSTVYDIIESNLDPISKEDIENARI